MRESNWISLGLACKLLGVNSSTLRNWADSGGLRTFRTPGGHRRFSRDDINVFIEAARAGSSLKPEKEWSRATLERVRRRLISTNGESLGWLSRFDEDGKARLRVMGRRLISLASEYGGKARPRTELDEEARFLGLQYGGELAKGGLSIQEAISAFFFFRNTLHASMVPDQNQEDFNLSPHVLALEDLVLLSIAESYEQLWTSQLPGRIPQGL